MKNQYELVKDPNALIAFIFGVLVTVIVFLFMGGTLLGIILIQPIIIAAIVFVVLVSSRESSNAKLDPSYRNKSWIEKISFKTLCIDLLLVAGIFLTLSLAFILAFKMMFNPG
jgi:hypothetical protein